MAWTIAVTRKARKQFLKLPKNIQDQVADAIDGMEADPFLGDVKRIQNKKWEGHFRRRVGRYRLIFFPFPDKNAIEIREVTLRSESTYR